MLAAQCLQKEARTMRVQELSVSLTALSVQSTRISAPEPLSPEARRDIEAAGLGEQLRISMAAERKAHARGVVDRLKEQITKLSALAFINPKGMAQILRMMSRQLASAAEDYARDGDSKAIKAGAEESEARARSLEERAQASVEILTAKVVELSMVATSRTDGERQTTTVALSAEITELSLIVASDSGAQGQVIDDVLARLTGAGDETGAVATPAAPAPFEQATKAYAATDPERAADEKFASDLAALRKVLETMFQAAMRRAEVEEAERETLAKVTEEFAEAIAKIKAAEDTIAAWWQDKPLPEADESKPTEVIA